MDTEVIRLRVEESPVKFGGRARVHSSVLDESEMEEGDLVVLSSAHRDVLVNIYSDKLIEEETIKLRSEDMDKLKVEEGEKIEMRMHQRLLKKNFLDNLL